MPQPYTLTRCEPDSLKVIRRPALADEIAGMQFRCSPAPDRLRINELINRGLVIIDKPAGCTSHDVVDRVRQILKIKRVGHSGTLDPEVTGVLPIGLGQATRMLSLLLSAGKTYDCELLLHGDADPEFIRETLISQVGTITQMPPIRSRVKRVEREREIYGLHITEIAGRRARFLVSCEAGTYIRKLCHDVGEHIGTRGQMAWLRRTEAGGFTLDDCVSLDLLKRSADEWRAAQGESLAVTTAEVAASRRLQSLLLPLECAMPREMPRIWMHEGALTSISTGSPLAVPGVLAYTANLEAGDVCALMTACGRLVALADADMGAETIGQLERGLAARPRKVFWPPATE